MQRTIALASLYLCLSVFIGGSTSSAAESAAPAAESKSIAPSPDAWPVFRGDALAQGVARCELPEKPELLWKQSFTRAFGAGACTSATSKGAAIA